MLALAAVTALVLFSACGGPPGPVGWAPARPVEAQQLDLVLVPYEDELFALQAGSTDVSWEFPPQNDDNYPLSESAKERLRAAVAALDADQETKDRLDARIDDLNVDGSSIDGMEDEIDSIAASASEELQVQLDELKDSVDQATKTERDALSNIDALYGDLALDDDETTVFVPAFSGWIFAIDLATSEARWMVDAQDEMVGGIAYSDGRLYFGTKGDRVYALDAETGEAVWRADVDGEVWATATVQDDAVYIPTFGGTVYRLNADSGEIEWEFGAADAGIAARPTVSDGTVYVGAFDDRLYAIDAASGEMSWSVEADNWFWAQAVVDGDTVYAASLDGKVYAVDAGSGDRRWEPFGAGSEIRSTPVVAGGALVVAGRDGQVHKIDLESGERLGAAADLASRIDADLAAMEDDVYVVPRNRTLYVIDAGGDLAAQSFPLP